MVLTRMAVVLALAHKYREANMQERRRSEDDTRDLVIETKAALLAHTRMDTEFHDEMKHDIEKLDEKLDKLNRNHAFGLGGLAVLYVLLQFPQLLHTIQPTTAQAANVRN